MLAVLVVSIGVLILYEYNGKHTGNQPNASDQNLLAVASSSPSIDTSVSQIDSDKDDLPDWEEALYGTNPNKADTDGDDTSDGKEVSLGRNPIVKGPNDFLASEENPVAASAAEENLTLTDTFARDFFTQYMNTQQSGTQITSANADQLASDYLKKTPLPSISAKQYTQADLLLVDSDKTHLSNYQNAIGAVFAKYWPSGKTNELTIMQQAFTNEDATALSNLTAIISAYQNSLNNILTIPVPKLAASLHLNVINSLSTYIQTLKMIRMAYTDPISGLVGLNAYQKNYANISVSLVNMQMYFINNLK